jgi:ribosome maturation factor RimP
MIDKVELEKVIQGVLAPLAIEVVGITIGCHGKSTQLCVYIDEPGGISIDRCSQSSRQIADALDRLDLIPSHYDLQVSSPGTDWPLREARDYRRHLNRKVRLDYSRVDEEKPQSVVGRIIEVDDQLLTLDVEGQVNNFELAKIVKAKIVVEFK